MYVLIVQRVTICILYVVWAYLGGYRYFVEYVGLPYLGRVYWTVCGLIQEGYLLFQQCADLPKTVI
jgi:hypothetical protein